MKTLTLTLMLLGSSLAYAQTPAPAAAKPAATNSGSDKLDIKKLEQKYWSAKDDDFAVVQNRRYTKANRVFLSLNAGVPFNDAFSAGSISSVNVGYFFNERWGLDLEYKNGNLTDNDSTKLFNERYGVYPDHNVFQSSQILSVTLVPFYAKMSFMDTSIIYFDMGFSAGAGMLNYSIKQAAGDLSESAPVAKLGVFQQIFFTEHLALRAELANTWSNQQRYKYYVTLPTSVGGGAVTDRDLGKKMINDTSLLLGLTYWF
ncbi:outer membrane beta-barrel domain-containing protein [Bdellovibrio sp. HCB337]|uniref:outer membrane beta-barrel domain-containing protein n=1 Tax=Bdellovibrio sp. HCB337 TaxID=3394358 RepID=UPI0039A67018